MAGTCLSQVAKRSLKTDMVNAFVPRDCRRIQLVQIRLSKAIIDSSRQKPPTFHSVRRIRPMGVIDSRVVNIDQLKLEHFAQGDTFECDALRIGPLLGAKNLGYSYDVVPPGKRSCPFHSHRGDEEMFFIVKGSGTLRYGDETRTIRAGDVICCPTGGPDTAHQIVNDSDAELTYLSVSTMMPVEVCEYPDSKKIGAFGGGLRHMTHANRDLDYWADET
jgi:uncharacterized cupin superfamily protein